MLYVSHNLIPYAIVKEIPDVQVLDHIDKITGIELRNDEYSNISVTFTLPQRSLLVAKLLPSQALGLLEVVNNRRPGLVIEFYRYSESRVEGTRFNTVEFQDLPTARNLKNYLKEGQR
jgi:hypothetical protein